MILRKSVLVIFIGAVGTSKALFGASVYNCTAQAHQCVVKVEDGIIGDKVKFLDDRARVIAVGRILKKKGDFALISVSQATRHIRKGYPVIIDVENRESSAQWTAAFSGN